MSTSPRVLRSFVDGPYVDPETDATIEVVSPVTAQVVATAPVSSVGDVNRAYAAAAFGTWGQATPAQRESALLKFADALGPALMSWSTWRWRTPASRTR